MKRPRSVTPENAYLDDKSFVSISIFDESREAHRSHFLILIVFRPRVVKVFGMDSSTKSLTTFDDSVVRDSDRLE